ncbi:hypothetical protein ACEQPO_22015 [Bacillus sp. SL00103]
MKYDHILVRFGEISTKGKNRKKFIEKLKATYPVCIERL